MTIEARSLVIETPGVSLLLDLGGEGVSGQAIGDVGVDDQWRALASGQEIDLVLDGQVLEEPETATTS